MLWINLGRIIRSGFVNFWRTPMISLASVVTIAASLFVISSLFLGWVFLQATLTAIKERVDISVAFKPDASETEVLSLKTSLESLSEVKEVVYRSREEELTEFQERHKDNAVILQSLEEVGNPFGARINIKAVDPSRLENIARFLESEAVLSPGGGSPVDQIGFKKDIVDRLINLIGVSERVGLAVAGVLVFISLVMVFNTVALAIYIAREEISLMKLVGASDRYIRGPFLVEGAIAGAIGALAAIVLLYPGAVWLRRATGGFYGGINLVSFFWENFGKIFALLILGGIGLGVTASVLALRRYLKRL